MIDSEFKNVHLEIMYIWKNTIYTLKKGAPCPAKMDGNEFDKSDKVISLSQYWPYGMNFDNKNIPEDKNLLYLHSMNVDSESKCYEGITEPFDYKTETELIQMYEYFDYYETVAVPFENHPEAFNKFLAEGSHKPPRGINVEYFLRHKNCPKHEMCILKISYAQNLQNLKYFHYMNRTCIYLNLSENLMSNISSAECWHIYKQVGFLNTGYFNAKSDDFNPFSQISDTFDFPEAVIPDGFGLDLRDYQLRTISWMQSIEAAQNSESNTITDTILNEEMHFYVKFKLGESPYYLGVDRGEMTISTSPSTARLNRCRMYAGILADGPGSGKTVTVLGLIHSSPFSGSKSYDRYERFGDELNSVIQSKASLIVCCQSSYLTWQDEAVRCNPNFKIIGLYDRSDLEKYSWNDLVDADIVIVMNQLLNGPSYTIIFKSAANEWSKHFKTNGKFDLYKIHFHRIIINGYHELADERNGFKLRSIEYLRADVIWGVTSTLTLKSLSDISPLSAPKRLIDIYKDHQNGCSEIISKYVKRTKTHLPPIMEDIIWIRLSDDESNLIFCSSLSKRTNYTHISTKYLKIDSDFRNDSIETILKSIAEEKRRAIEHAEADIRETKRRIKSKLEDDQSSKIAQLENNLTDAKNDLEKFSSISGSIGDLDRDKCLICHGIIEHSSLSILGCGHLFCYGYIVPLVESDKACPHCQYKVNYRTSISRFRKYTSKMVRFYRYITDLFQRDTNARVVLYFEYKSHTDSVAEILGEFKINYVRITGTESERNSAIEQFQIMKTKRLILMTFEENIKGIILTEATHFIILQPFFSGDYKEEQDIFNEKQGIFCAYRYGRKRPLTVVRFASLGTFDEKMTLTHKGVESIRDI